jgi:hypothetical protein
MLGDHTSDRRLEKIIGAELWEFHPDECRAPESGGDGDDPRLDPVRLGGIGQPEPDRSGLGGRGPGHRRDPAQADIPKRHLDGLEVRANPPADHNVAVRHRVPAHTSTLIILARPAGECGRPLQHDVNLRRGFLPGQSRRRTCPRTLNSTLGRGFAVVSDFPSTMCPSPPVDAERGGRGGIE